MIPNRVLIVAGDFVLTGGMDRANYALADYLARQGTQVELVAHRVAPELLAYPNVTHHRVPKLANSYFLSSYLLDKEGRKRAKAISRLGGRVFVNGGNCNFGDINWVHYIHAAYKPETRTTLRRLKQMVERPTSMRAEQRVLAKAKLVIANSNVTRDFLVERMKIPPNRVKTIYYGIDATRFKPATAAERLDLRSKFGWDDSPRVVFVGALGDRRKGFDILASAWIKLCQQDNWDAKLVVIGSGADQAYWKNHLTLNGCGDSFEFLGFRSDVPELLRAADCLVAPTRYEAYGLGVHEAICCGLAAFVSQEAGVVERYPANLAELLLEHSSDANMLADRLASWRRDVPGWSTKLLPLLENLRTSTWDTMSKQIIEELK